MIPLVSCHRPLEVIPATTIAQYVLTAGSCCAVTDVRESSTCSVTSQKFMEFQNRCTRNLFLVERSFKSNHFAPSVNTATLLFYPGINGFVECVQVMTF